MDFYCSPIKVLTQGIFGITKRHVTHNEFAYYKLTSFYEQILINSIIHCKLDTVYSETALSRQQNCIAVLHNHYNL